VRTPLPSQVRILAKSLAHSKDVLSKGIFNPSGKGSRTYHENRITTLQPYLDKYSYLLEMRAKPMKPTNYYSHKSI